MHANDVSWERLVEAARAMGRDPELAGLSDGEVEQQVRTGASRIAALQCRWLLVVAELVVRGVWADQGARTPGAWLSWACGESAQSAREKVRVALALRNLPRIRARFAAGTLSYSKVRAITRVAVPEIEPALIDLADSAPASQLDRIVALSRRSADELTRWQDGPPIDDAPDARDVRRVQVDADTVELRIRLPKADAMALEQRIDRLVDLADRADRADQPNTSQPLDVTEQEGAWRAGRPSRGARRAQAVCDALAVAVAVGPPDRSGVDDHLVVLHVEATELVAAVADGPADTASPDLPAGDHEADRGASAEAPPRGSPGPASSGVRTSVRANRTRSMYVPRSVLARLTCDARLRIAGMSEDGHPADVGRRSRTVPADLRRALELRDRHCRFPGCHATRHLHAHHVIHWARGGATDLSNLLLVCSHHHRVVHDRGWTLRAIDPAAGRWRFHPPGADRPHPAVRAMPGASAEAVRRVDDATPAPHPTALQPPWWDGWYDLDETVRVVSAYLLDHAPVVAPDRIHPAVA